MPASAYIKSDVRTAEVLGRRDNTTMACAHAQIGVVSQLP